jgi:hypothetical protein
MSAGSSNQIVQIAHAVDDVREAAVRSTHAVGVGPFFVHENVELGETRLGGSPGRFDQSSAFGQLGDLNIELICVHAAEPEALAASVGVGAVGIHHVTWSAGAGPGRGSSRPPRWESRRG